MSDPHDSFCHMSAQLFALVVICLGLGAVGGGFGHAWLARRRSGYPPPTVGDLPRDLQDLSDRVESLRREQLTEQTRISEQLRALSQTNAQVHQNTARLAQALNHTGFRGKWGEAQLRRIVEAAGLMPGVHFDEQIYLVSHDDDAGARTLRPDMVINLSDDRHLVIDAKVPIDSLISGDVIDDAAMRAQARALATHIDQLASREYWRQFERSPAMVVLFLPAESLLGPELSADPSLLERAFGKGVVLATPSTLLALLRTVAMGWRERDLGENAAQIHQLGKQLYERLSMLNGHLNRLGGNLSSAVSSYNQLVGSYESRVLVSARRMSDLGIGDTRMDEIAEIDERTRSLAGVAAPVSKAL